MASKILPAVVAVAVAVGVYTYMSGGGSIEDRIAATVEELQAELPMQVDEVTSWDAVSAEGAVLIYTYSLSLPTDQLDGGVLEAQKPAIAAQACATEDMRGALDEGATFRYVYNAEDGTEVGRVEISSSDC